MESERYRESRARAIAFLSSLSEESIASMPLRERSFLLRTIPAEIVKTRRLIAEQIIPELTIELIRTGNLGDVFAMLEALWQYDRQSITGDILAAAVHRLVEAEAAVGGPYAHHDKTICPLANIYIALFLASAADIPPSLRQFLERTLKKNFHQFLVDANGVPLLHMLWNSPFRGAIWPRKPPRSALDEKSLLELTFKLITAPTEARAAIWQPLIALQKPEGNWGDGQAGTLVTALLASMLPQMQAVKINRASTHQQVIRNTQELFSSCKEPLRRHAQECIQALAAADAKHEIALFPYFFAGALAVPSPLSRQQCELLGMANVCTWAAYTIYDDFLDNEGAPEQLPFANEAMRLAMRLFQKALSHDEDFLRFTSQVFTRMEEANSWELKHCRFALQKESIIITALPKYGNRRVLAHRAFAHALGPLAIAKMCGAKSRQYKNLEHAFEYYLIARQLNDDLHDWQEDLRAGRISPVVARILEDMRIRPGVYPLGELIVEMQQYFREVSLVKIYDETKSALHRSRRSFKASRLLTPQNEIYALLDDLASSLEHTQDLAAKSQNFLFSYGM